MLRDLWRRFVDDAETIGLRATRTALRRMSWNEADRFGALIGAAFHTICLPRRIVAMRSLRTAFRDQIDFPEADRIARNACVHFSQSMIQFLRLPEMAPEEVLSRVELIGAENYRTAAARGRGVIILTAHFGNWELLGARLALEGIPLTVIARGHNNATIGHIVRQTRETGGMRVFEKENTILHAVRILQNNGTIGILPDQHAGNQGIPIEFFGRVTQMHSVVARLARTTGAAVVPVYCPRTHPCHYTATIYPMLKLRRTSDKTADMFVNTRLMTRILEEQIREYPDQWLWVHKRWREIDRKLAAAHDNQRSKAVLVNG
jgi:KDO2-lipid IV(A) lauroyltransferase